MNARYGPCVDCGKHRELDGENTCKWCKGVANRPPEIAHKRNLEHARTDKPYQDAAAGRAALRALDDVVRGVREAGEVVTVLEGIYRRSRRRKGRRT